ncbi:MAG: RHS repeat-associated core domain-containing protein, partial [Terriglobales bacterium]
YVYEGEGRRVKRVVEGVTRVYVYNTFGQMVAEYHSPNLAPETPKKAFIHLGGKLLAMEEAAGTSYIAADHLGSTRVVTNQSGNVDSRHDYLPFGKEVPTDFGGRSSVAGYGAEQNLLQRFTGKEVDPETGLEYFGARYYSGRQARFTSPDAFLVKKEWLYDPQRLHRYAYVRNNPLRFIDPDGEDLIIYEHYGSDLTDEQRRKLERLRQQIRAAIAKKFKDAGVKRVEFRDASTLSKKQIQEIIEKRPAGVAFLNIVNRSYGNVPAGEGEFGRTYASRQSVVFQGPLSSGTPTDETLAFRVGEVASHELGHSVGFESNYWIQKYTFGFAQLLRSNIMDEQQDMPRTSYREKSFDKKSEKNQRVIEEINAIRDNTPKP